MTHQKLIRRLNTVQVLTSCFFNLSITIISDNDLVHVEHIPFYLPHKKKISLSFPIIHHQITCKTENDKQTEISIGKTPGQKIRLRVSSSLILKQKMCPLEQRGPQTNPSKEANTGPKHCKQSNAYGAQQH